MSIQADINDEQFGSTNCKICNSYCALQYLPTIRQTEVGKLTPAVSEYTHGVLL